MKRNEKLDSLFAQDYCVIDFLPRLVPENAQGIYEEVEQYFLQDKQLKQFCERAVSLILKILCYYPFEMYVQEYVPIKNQREGWLKDKRCETIVRILRRVILKKKGQIDILLYNEDAMISIVGGVMSIAVYHESDSLRNLLDSLTSAEGFYYWKYRI